MKIVLLSSVFGKHAIGGAERTVAAIGTSLHRRGHQVTMVSLGAPGQAAQRYTDANGLSVWHIPLAQLYDPFALAGKSGKTTHHAASKALWHLLDVYNPIMARRLRHVLQELRPDVVSTHTLQGFSVAAWQEARRAGAKLIHMTHDLSLICPRTAMTRGPDVCTKVCGDCAVYGALRHGLATMPDAIVGPSSSVLERHRQFGWFRQVARQQVIPNSLADNWPPCPAQIPLGEPLTFGFLGRLDESKGVDTLLQALQHLPAGSCRLRIAGAGDVAGVKRRWLPSGWEAAVTFPGTVQAAQFMQEIDVLITPSRAQETFCNVVLEATSLGRPAIVADSGALPERVEHGKSGWIIPAGSSQALAEAMRHCLENPQEVRQKGSYGASMRSLYSAQAQGDLFEALCLGLINGEPHNVGAEQSPHI